MSEVLKLSEFEEIAFKLETHHSIFYKLWEMGEMVFDEEIPTACVKFDRAVIMFRFILILSLGIQNIIRTIVYYLPRMSTRLVESRTPHKKRRTSSIG